MNAYGFSKQFKCPFFEPNSVLNEFMMVPSKEDSIENIPREMFEEFQKMEKTYGLDSFVPKGKEKKHLANFNI